MSVITFLYSECPQLDDTLASSRLRKSITPAAMDFCSKAVQIRCNASFNLEIVLGIISCLWLLQAAQMWHYDIISVKTEIYIFVILWMTEIRQQRFKSGSENEGSRENWTPNLLNVNVNYPSLVHVWI